MSKKVTLRALDHILMASLRHREGSSLVVAKKLEEAKVKFKESAKHMQLAAEQEDFDDTLETLNSANEEGWEDDEELDEELDEEALDGADEEIEEADAEEDLDMTVEDDEGDEDEAVEEVDEEAEMSSALASAATRSARRAALAAESASDEDDSEFKGDVDGDGDIDADDFKKADEEAAATLASRRKIRAQANLRLLGKDKSEKTKPKAKK